MGMLASPNCHWPPSSASIHSRRPATTPIYYRVSARRLTTADRIEVSGGDSSGEVEFALIGWQGRIFVGLGSDHTDRKVETYNITVSKQMCDKPVAVELWSFAEVQDHWDRLVLRSWAISKGKNWLMRPFYPETVTEVGPVPVVPYAEPLTEKLARSFEPFLAKYDTFIMQNHGLVSMTRSGIKETLMNVELLEMSASSIMMALQAGEIHELEREHVRDLSNTMRTRDLPLFGAPGVNKTLEDLYF